ncbi:MAG: orotidine-5'-phosphate decarboxylase, partial [Myxococcota bacterium]|nr:orotidine-5'-phosphate decarboxylase [Myxococcota bacterium]
DGKRGDISSTATAYAQAALDPDGPLGCDALTVNPWMGLDTLEPFMELCRAHGSGIFVLLRTTNPGSAELQLHGDPPLARRIATALDRLGQDTVGSAGLSSVGVVVGAQVAEEARRLREQLPRAWFLVPGLGFQGGSVDDALAGSRPDGLGSLAVAARSVLYPSEPDALYEQDTFGWIANRASHLVTRVRGGIA